MYKTTLIDYGKTAKRSRYSSYLSFNRYLSFAE